MIKAVFLGFQTKSDTNWAVHLQKMVRGLKLRKKGVYIYICMILYVKKINELISRRVSVHLFCIYA